MVCTYPVRFDGVHPAPCGQCVECRINRQREWGTRIALELRDHSYNSFLTLTYKDAPALPVKRHVQLFLKRFRKAHGRVRFFCAAELGGQRGRPHYHLILFGVRATPEMESLCLRTWKLGFVQLKEVRDIGAADYVCKYILKAQISEQPSPDGIPASWSLMSRRPGIGRRTLDYLAGELDTRNIRPASSLGLQSPTGTPDWDAHSKIISGTSVRLDGHLRPLDRYSRKFLFPEKEGLSVARLKTLTSSAMRFEGGSFSVVFAEAERILSARQRGRAAMARAKRVQL